MKAVTVADGSSDDPEIEQGAAVAGTEPDVAPEIRDDDPTQPHTPHPRAHETPPAPEADPKPTPDAEAGAEAGGRAQAGRQDRAEANTDAEPEAEPRVEPNATAGAGADAEAGAEATAAVEPVAEAEPEVDASDEAATEHSAQPTAEAGAEPEAQATAVPKDPAGSTAPETEANAERDAAAEPEAKAGAETTPDGGAEPTGVVKPVAEGDAASEIAAEGDGAVKTEAKAAGEGAVTGRLGAPANPTAPEAETDGNTGPRSEGGEAAAQAAREVGVAETAAGSSAAATGPAIQAVPKADAKVDTEAKAGGKGPAKAGLGGGAAPEADAAVKPVAEAEGNGAAKAALAGAPAHPTAPEAGAAVKPVAEAGGDAKTEGKGAAKAGPAGAAAPETDAAVKPEAEAGGDAKAAPKADTEAGGDAKAGGKGAAKGGPAGAAAPEAEAGGDAEGEGAAPAGRVGAPAVEGGGGEDGADVTQVLVAPRPKVPSWAREGGAGADSERTSQFVALKPLDVPPAAPPAPPARPAAPQPPEANAPLPPLDLLAELTNTAPPPETPRRTAVRRVKVWTPVLLLLAGAYVGAQMLRPLPAPQMVSTETDRTVEGQFSIPWPAQGQGAVRVVGSGGLGTFGEQKPVPTASVAKVMTAYVILKGHPLRKSDPGPDVTVDAKAVADGNSEFESRITGLTVGQKFGQQDMLKMLMIPSGNNVARLLARWDTGSDSEAAFVEKMNAAAKELGMTNTTYTDPSGLDAGTVSTAADQLKLAEAVMQDETFRAIVALPTASIKGLSTPLTNNNVLLTTTGGLSVRGIKTGSSTPAGGTLLWAAYKTVGDKDQLILGALMDQHVDGPDPEARNSLALVQANSKKIIEAVRGALASAPVIRKGQQVGYLDDGLGGRMPLVATKDLDVIGVPGQQLKLSLAPGAAPLPHTAKAGSEVGVLTVGEGEAARSVPVAVRGDLAEPSFGTRMTRVR
ncbi:serine hydrolase [Streptomyces sp. NPDC005533]|uniref:D-alanyl-D-alanine carboxypeptidase n=1 Tax=Streptomyces sp. NPDC005533 TaxID=3364723 RepID=UPI0036898F08